MIERIRVALIHPHGCEMNTFLPLSLAYLKACLDDSEFDVKIIDCTLQKIRYDSIELSSQLTKFNPQIVALSTLSHTYQEGLDLLKRSKKLLPSVVTIIGGAHATTYFKETMKNPEIDFLFRGEGEESFPLFIKKIIKGEDVSKISGLVYRGPQGLLQHNGVAIIEDLDSVSLPDYESINLDEYYRRGYRYNTKESHNAPIWLTRGCPYRCQYCAAPQLNGKPIRKQSPNYVINWIRYLYHKKDVRWINIIDDNFTFDVKYAKEVCRDIIDLGLKDLKFGTPNGIRMQRGDPELWKLMKKAGWTNLVVAPESGSLKVLQRMKKDLNLEIVPGIVDDMRKAKIGVKAFFIVGYPGETKDDLMATRRFILNCDFDNVLFNMYRPIPGTPIYNEQVAAGDISSHFLPTYNEVKSNYMTPTLKGVNVKLFVAITFLLFFLRKPRRIFYFLKNHSVIKLIKGMNQFSVDNYLLGIKDTNS